MPNSDCLTEIMENIPLNNHFSSITREVSSSNGCLCVCMYVGELSVCGRVECVLESGVCEGEAIGVCEDCVVWVLGRMGTCDCWHVEAANVIIASIYVMVPLLMVP